MSVVSQRRSNLNPNAPLFIPAAVRQVEDYSPEWWQLVKTSTWFHDYWLSQQQPQQGADGSFGNTADDCDIVDMLPDSIDTDEDLLSMEAQYEQFLHSSWMESVNAFSSPAYQQMPSNGLGIEAETLIRSLSLSKATPGSRVEMARYAEKPVRSFSPKIHSQRIQQPR
ncbi:putative PAM2-containing protein CID1/CID2 [Helianthus anomalus]